MRAGFLEVDRREGRNGPGIPAARVALEGFRVGRRRRRRTVVAQLPGYVLIQVENGHIPERRRRPYAEKAS